MDHEKHKLFLEYVKLVLEVLMFVVVCIGAYIGWNEYKDNNKASKDANSVSVLVKIDEAERKIYELAITYDYLNAFWAYFPEDMSAKDLAKARISLLMNDNINEDGNIYAWNDVRDLEHIIFSCDSFCDDKLKRLRTAYNMAEQTLYIVESASNAKSKGIIGDDVYQSYISYVYDIGSHPLFLEAIYFGHETGFLPFEFAKELKKIYMTNKLNRETAELIYPDIIHDPDWAEKVGVNKAATADGRFYTPNNSNSGDTVLKSEAIEHDGSRASTRKIIETVRNR